MGSTIETPRRYYLLKRRITLDREDSITTQWHAKQDEEPGTPLPASFPFLDRLGTFYSTQEDLDGADVPELQSFGFTRRDACIILTAEANLLAS